MKDENDDLVWEDIIKFKYFENSNLDDIINRKFQSSIKPMNLDIQKLNEIGIYVDEGKDVKEMKEKERYTLFNYDSDDEYE